MNNDNRCFSYLFALIALSGFICLYLISCSNSSIEDRLLGTWREDSNKSAITIIFHPDHSFTGKRDKKQIQGTWEIKKDRIVSRVQESSIPCEIGAIWADRIVQLNKLHLVIRDQFGHVQSFNKIREEQAKWK